MKVFSINDIPEFSKKERIVVIGIVGKSSYRYPNKTTPLLPSVKCDKNDIECHWDERRNVLYLHAVTYLDTRRLAELAVTLDENSKTTEKDADASHWLVAAGELAAESCRAIALLFHLCHIVILSSPTSVFDLGYLQLFKAVDAYRAELQQRTTTALTSLNVGGAWETHGRSCCPRLLFHFRRAPRPLRSAPASLKRLEHAVEDQLYFILRKARIITNVCAKSLFAIPKNEEFVYISADDANYNARDVSSLVRGLVQLCTGDQPTTSTDRMTFKQFLQGHIDLAFGEGFDDNVGKYAMSTSFFELPSASTWRAIAQALTPIYLEESSNKDDSDADVSNALYDSLATDVRFSQARCAKVLPIAQASYAEGLPAHYSSQHHAHKVGVALGVLETMARGPLAGAARARLRAACAAAWRTRSLCEALSLTGHPCIEPEHDSSKEHSSGVRYVCACNCGRSRRARDDPYSVRSANYGFYQQAADECAACRSLLAASFPVFQPSTPTYRAASVKGASSQEAEVSESRSDGDGNSAGSPDAGFSAPDALSPGSGDGDAEGDGEGDSGDKGDSLGSARTDDQFELVSTCVRGTSTTEKVISRQPSTTEYLPGMLHTASPPGLLPAFPSWSLVCLGASSLYSHSLGLPEHLQPGFLPHTNYLLPWDCAVRTEQVSAWRAGAARGRGRAGPAGPAGGAGALAHPHPHHLTVKIFIGFEYECPRGHRFMMSGPETVVNGGGSAASGSGARLAASTMPLYAACACRPAAAAPAAHGPHASPPAQLMRVHVVTPKAPVHVTLDPKVQPAGGGPVFTAGGPAARLSASAYWVLRLPLVYADERGPAPRPRAPPPAAHPAAGRVLAPLFGLEE